MNTSELHRLHREGYESRASRIVRGTKLHSEAFIERVYNFLNTRPPTERAMRTHAYFAGAYNADIAFEDWLHVEPDKTDEEWEFWDWYPGYEH